MTKLVNELEKFNRKERYWLLWNCIGEVNLHKDFIERLGGELDLKIPSDAWWAIDYHFDWFAGAIACFGGKKETAIENSEFLIMGTQQDIDFIVAFENTVILIEAKVSTGWSKDQWDQKLRRLTALRNFTEKLQLNMTIRLLLMSPCNPGPPISDCPAELRAFLPDSGNSKIPWLPLSLKTHTFLPRRDALKVSRRTRNLGTLDPSPLNQSNGP